MCCVGFGFIDSQFLSYDTRTHNIFHLNSIEYRWIFLVVMIGSLSASLSVQIKLQLKIANLFETKSCEIFDTRPSTDFKTSGKRKGKNETENNGAQIKGHKFNLIS